MSHTVVHEEFNYDYNQCEYRATQKGNLACHIHSIHDRIKYECKKYEYRASILGNLIFYIQSVHEESKYDCTNGKIELLTRVILHVTYSQYM